MHLMSFLKVCILRRKEVTVWWKVSSARYVWRAMPNVTIIFVRRDKSFQGMVLGLDAGDSTLLEE